MKIFISSRGFEVLEHPSYANEPVLDARLASQSSAINFEYDDALERPGTSFLWIGDRHHLNREEVAQFIKHLQWWADTGSLDLDHKRKPDAPSGDAK